MGYNTVAFMLNDLMGDIKRSPNAYTYLLTNPIMGSHEVEKNMIFKHANEVAKEYNEPRLHFQAIEVMPTFHADFTQYYRAGQNSIDNLQFHKTTTVKMRDGSKKKAVVLILPDYLQEDME